MFFKIVHKPTADLNLLCRINFALAKYCFGYLQSARSQLHIREPMDFVHTLKMLYVYVSMFIYIQVFLCMFAWVNKWCAVDGLANPLCTGVCKVMCTYLCVLLRGPPALWNTNTNIHTHKQLELNEAELSLVPISLIINNFSLPPNTLINLQRRLCVHVCERMYCMCVWLCLPGLMHVGR